MSLGHRNIESRGTLIGILGGILDNQTFRTRRRRLVGLGLGPRLFHLLEPHEPADSMLQMDHEIPFNQIRKIDFQCRFYRCRMLRFQSSGTLNLVTAENLCIGHHRPPGGLDMEPAPQDSNLDAQLALIGFASPTQLVPYFDKSVPLPLIVAEDIYSISLPQPSVHLLKELLPLALDHLESRCPSVQWTIRFQTFEGGNICLLALRITHQRSGVVINRIGAFLVPLTGEFQEPEPSAPCLTENLIPGQ